MSQLVYPIAGVGLLFLVLIPSATLTLVGCLRLLPGRATPAPTGVGVYLLLLSPSLAPAVWLLSAALHQSEAHSALVACLNEHAGAAGCLDALLLAQALLMLLAWRAARVLWPRRETRGTPATGRDARSRLARLCSAYPALARHEASILLVEGAIHPLSTRGIVRQRIELDARLLAQLDDAELAGALLHEVAHLQSRDPLSFALLGFAMALNPLGSLLTPELRRWRLGREAACDRAAVREGADPLALAAAIVQAAKTAPPLASAVTLGGRGIGEVRLRVQLLLEQAEAGCALVERQRGVGFEGGLLVLALLGILLALPHSAGASGLDTFHHAMERTTQGVLSR